MFGITQELWTYEINNDTLLIDSNYGLTKISVVLNSGSGTITGDLQLANGVSSAPITMVIGQPITIPSNSGVPLNNITITTTGVVAILGFQ